jgi:hypothetical protein
MAVRLAKVEQLNQQLTKQLVEKSRENLALQTENEVLRQSCAGNDVEAALRKERDQLACQLHNMEQILHDLGIRRPPVASQSKREDTGSRARSVTDSATGMTVDIHVIQTRLDSLNAMLEQKPAAVGASNRGGHGNIASLAVEDVVLPLTFFFDGLKLADHAFVPYDLRPAQDVIKDILEGCFPRALHTEYPDGVRLRSVDRTSVAFKDYLRDQASSDPMLADGADRLRPNAGHVVNKDSRSAGDRLLAKLPEHVIKGGRVCNVRSTIAKQLGAASSPGSKSGADASRVVGTGAQKSDEVVLLDADRDAAAPYAKLQVKLEGGQRVFLSMEPQATVGAICEALMQWQTAHGIVGNLGRSCTLRSAFPPRIYSDHALTLEAAGLTPSATLFVTCEPVSDHSRQ